MRGGEAAGDDCGAAGRGSSMAANRSAKEPEMKLRFTLQSLSSHECEIKREDRPRAGRMRFRQEHL
jgi:hypothetical protein